MSSPDGAWQEFSKRPHVLIGVLALIAAVICLLTAADHVFRLEKDPNAFAVDQCGGGLGGNPLRSEPETSNCYARVSAETPLQAAGSWLIGGVGATTVVCLCVIEAWRRRTD